MIGQFCTQATWHPLFDDVCIVGRYPCSEDKDQTRCVDIIDLKCARVVGRFMDCSMSQLMVVKRRDRVIIVEIIINYYT